jgi:GT2 family glycosyltransferase
VTTLFIHKVSHKMMMSHIWFGWMKSSYKLHFYVITIVAWCHELSFVILILCDVSKAIRPFNNCMWYLPMLGGSHFFVKTTNSSSHSHFKKPLRFSILLF